MEDISECNEDNFKEVFKYYKRRKPPPDLNRVLQVDDGFEEGEKILPRPLTDAEEEESKELGLVSQKDWRIFNFKSHPDLLFIKNPFSSKGQLRWIQTCLMEYPSHPNKTNLDNHGILLSDRPWWEQAMSDEGRKKDLRKKLRWVTLGYHHNWDTKEYSEDMRGDMPENLTKLCGLIAKVLGFDDFNAQAAIINFYHEDSSLGPHTDHSEPNMKAPLFSFSFGQSAVFLIGDSSKTTKPSAIYLHSGDIVVMSGATRLAYHAIPRIVIVEEKPWLDIANSSINESDHYHKSTEKFQNMDNNISDTYSKEMMESNTNLLNILHYVGKSRINMNVRQVLLPRMQNLPL